MIIVFYLVISMYSTAQAKWSTNDSETCDLTEAFYQYRGIPETLYTETFSYHEKVSDPKDQKFLSIADAKINWDAAEIAQGRAGMYLKKKVDSYLSLETRVLTLPYSLDSLVGLISDYGFIKNPVFLRDGHLNTEHSAGPTWLYQGQCRHSETPEPGQLGYFSVLHSYSCTVSRSALEARTPDDFHDRVCNKVLGTCKALAFDPGQAKFLSTIVSEQYCQ